VVQGDFSSFVGAETIGFSECQFDLVVKALNNGAGNSFFGAKVV
jgi:hypothetical protein